MTYMGGSTRTWVFLAISVYVHCNLLGLVLCQNDLSMIDNYQHAVLKLLDESDSNVISAAILVAVSAEDESLLQALIQHLPQVDYEDMREDLAQMILDTFGTKTIASVCRESGPRIVEGLLVIDRLADDNSEIAGLLVSKSEFFDEDAYSAVLVELKGRQHVRKEYIPIIKEIALDGSRSLLHRTVAIRVLAEIDVPEARAAILEVFQDKSVEDVAAWAIGYAGIREGLDEIRLRLQEILESPEISQVDRGQGEREPLIDGIATEKNLLAISAFVEAICMLDKPSDDLIQELLSGNYAEGYAAMMFVAYSKRQINRQIILEISKMPREDESLTLTWARFFALGASAPDLGLDLYKSVKKIRPKQASLRAEAGFLGGLRIRQRRGDVTSENTLQNAARCFLSSICKSITLELLTEANEGSGSNWEPGDLLNDVDERVRVWAALSMQQTDQQALQILEDYLKRPHPESRADLLAIKKIAETSPALFSMIREEFKKNPDYSDRIHRLIEKTYLERE